MENSARSFSAGCMVGCRDSSLGNPGATAPTIPCSPNPPRARHDRREVAPGVHWLRMALPFALDHINLWAAGRRRRLAARSTPASATSRRARCGTESSPKSSVTRPVKRVLVTHYHPDHAGNAAWLCQRSGAELWMTRGEFLTVHAARNSSAGYTTEAQMELFRSQRPR